MTIIRIGVDTSKHVFQLHGVDEKETPALRRQLRRGEVEKFFAKLPPARIGIEACGASHHWGRALRALGHEVVLIPPQYVKPYLKRGKNDALSACPRAGQRPDPWAEAICEAMSRPGMRFVAIKSAETQAALMMVRTRDLLVKQRTMLINAIRGHAAEFGVTGAKGPGRVAALLERVQEDASVPALAREMLDLLAGQLSALEARLAALEKRLMARHREDPEEPTARHDTGHRADRRGQLLAQGAGCDGVPLGPPLCRLARHHPARPFDRGPAAAGPDQPGGRRESAPAVGARRHRRHPPGQIRPRLALASRSAGAQAEEARGGRAGQQDGPHDLGHAGERRSLSLSQSGLNRAPHAPLWRLQGQQQDGDRSVRGSEQPAGSNGA